MADHLQPYVAGLLRAHYTLAGLAVTEGGVDCAAPLQEQGLVLSVSNARLSPAPRKRQGAPAMLETIRVEVEERANALWEQDLTLGRVMTEVIAAITGQPLVNPLRLAGIESRGNTGTLSFGRCCSPRWPIWRRRWWKSQKLGLNEAAARPRTWASITCLIRPPRRCCTRPAGWPRTPSLRTEPRF